MKLTYRILIESPENHIVKMAVKGKRGPQDRSLTFFLPRWSPGSYVLREYGKNIRFFKAESFKGETLFHQQTAGGVYEVFWDHPEFLCKDNNFIITYEIFCHEMTVRTSHVDASHAFLHGPSLFMGLVNIDIKKPLIQLTFPPLWSKVTTPLKDISNQREHFFYEAQDYDHLLDSPIEIGCHETDGLMEKKRPHHLSFYGTPLPHNYNIKEHIRAIVQTTCKLFPEVPYEHYYFMNSLAPHIYGGLEHRDSSVIHYCSKSLVARKGYLNYLSLVAHEYFHTWNIKRIRPTELGPFDYLKENYTDMLWLSEGLTVFMEYIILYQANLCSLQEYLEEIVANINRYNETMGRKFHSLEQSSFNAWIKLYHPNEFTKNSTVSYYLKGGLVFFCLQVLFIEQGKSLKHLLALLWQHYKKNPKKGLKKSDVLSMIQSLTNKDIAETFDLLVSGVDEINFKDYFQRAGFDLHYEKQRKISLGFTPRFEGERVFIKDVTLDSGAYKSGLNAGDELLAVNGQRFTKADVTKFSDYYQEGRAYRAVLSRLGNIIELNYTPSYGPRKLKTISLKNKTKVQKTLKYW